MYSAPASMTTGGGDSGSYPAAHDVNAFPDDEANPRVLYVGNLPPSVDENLLMTIFSKGVMKYAFVEFTDHGQAAAVKSFMNERDIHGSKIRINWKTQPRKDTSNHYHIFVGDLSPEVTNDDLLKLFCKCGEVSDAKVIRDSNTNKSKGYGFVSFVNKKEAEKAKDSLNGTMVGSRAIRINWAARKPSHGTSDNDNADRNTKAQNYRAISKQASETNTTVYVGNVTAAISEDALRNTFENYGSIQTINMFPQKGYAFVIFYDHDSATKAIAHANGLKIDGIKIKCNWGRENTREESRRDYPEYPNYGYGEDRTFDDAGHHTRGAPGAHAAGYGAQAVASQYDYSAQGYGSYDPNYYYPSGGYQGYGQPPHPHTGAPNAGNYGAPPPGPHSAGYGPPQSYGGHPPLPPQGSYGPPPPGYSPMPPNAGYPPPGPGVAHYPPPSGHGPPGHHAGHHPSPQPSGYPAPENPPKR